LSLRIYLDDCAFSHRLRQRLQAAGHEVQTPGEADPSLTGAADERHFAHARATGLVILTYNPADFLRLHHLTPDHPGILAVYQDNDPSKDMTYADITQAIANLEETTPTVARGFWILNAYQW
jgi:predicted nuclease of predicted toxin-antitoxin system